LKSISAIPQLIENGIFIEEFPAEKDDAKYDSYRYYAAGLKIGDVDYTVKMVIGVKQGKKYYDHALTQIEKGTLIDLINSSAYKSFTPNGGAPLHSYSLSGIKDTKLISILQINDIENAKRIKLATGWERGADGKWRYEVPDAEFADGWYDIVKNGGTKRLSDVVENKDLFNAYPELKNVAVLLDDLEGISGSYSNKIITINRNNIGNENMLFVIAHEVQHAIQDIEGFARGSNPNRLSTVADEAAVEAAKKRFYSILDDKAKENGFFEVEETRREVEKRRKRVDALNREIDGLDLEDEKVVADNEELFEAAAEVEGLYNNALESLQFLENALRRRLGDEGYREARDAYYKWAVSPPQLSPLAQYERNSGEVEARNVEARRNMTPEERRRTLAYETEDVARQDQIFIYDSYGEQRSADIREVDPVRIPQGFDSVYVASTGQLLLADRGQMRVLRRERMSVRDVMRERLIREAREMLEREC
jgi:hypothetical protein